MSEDIRNRNRSLAVAGALSGAALSALTLGAWCTYLFAIWWRFPEENSTTFAISILIGWFVAIVISATVVWLCFPKGGKHWVIGCLLSILASPVLMQLLGLPLGAVAGLGGQILWLRLATTMFKVPSV